MKSNLTSKIENKYNNIQYKNQMIKDSHEKEIFDKIPKIKQIKKEISLNTISYMQNSEIRNNTVKLNKIQKRNKELNNRILSLLEKEGYPKNYLDLQFDCNKCKDKGYVKKKNKYIRCSCYYYYLVLEFYKDTKYSLPSNISFDEFDFSLFSDRKNTKTNLSDKELMQHLQNDFISFAENFNPNNPTNFYLFGKTGVGKTFILISLVKKLINRKVDALYLSATSMFNLINEYKSSVFNNDPDPVIYNLLYKINVLIIDDLVVESFTESRYAEFLELINSRLSNNLSTFIASNLSPTDLCDSYDERAYSRITGNYKIVRLDGKDLRIIKKRTNNQNQ